MLRISHLIALGLASLLVTVCGAAPASPSAPGLSDSPTESLQPESSDTDPADTEFETVRLKILGMM